MLCEFLYADDWGQYLPGPSSTVFPTEAPSAHISTTTGLLFQGGYITDSNLWKCPSAQAQNPHFIDWPFVDHGPRTFDYTHTERTWCMPYTDTLDPANPTMYKTKWDENILPGKHRKITTFPRPSSTVVLAEENTGLVPDNCGLGSGDFSAVLNDPRFCRNDLIEPRHLGASTAACLDGHVIIILCSLKDCETHSGRFLYEENGPKQIHLMPEYCPER
jgi:hypothetical protein